MLEKDVALGEDEVIGYHDAHGGRHEDDVAAEEVQKD